MRDQVFVKQFEDDYNLSRELALIADLSQRAAPVPRVISSDYQNLTLSMENRGKSLVEWLPMLSDQEVLVALSKSVDAFLSIGKLGVCHIDIAARNILFETRWVSKAQVIDFNAALCQRFPLQKPIWILPTAVSHHPLLAEAIAEDWTRFFDSSRLPRPSSFSHPFDIPWDHYRRYWPERLKSNELAGAMDRILAFGIGGLLEEVAQSRTDPLRSRLKAQTSALRSCTSEKQARAELQQLMESLSSNQATPVPRLYSGALLGGGAVAPLPLSRWSDFASWIRRGLVLGLALMGIVLTDMAYDREMAALGDLALWAGLMLIPLTLILAFAVFRGRTWVWLPTMFVLMFQGVLLQGLMPQADPVTAFVPALPTILGLALALSEWRWGRATTPNR